MKVYRVELIVIDHDEEGPDELKTIIEQARYPNRCIAPEVRSMQEAEIGEWDDEHPLNSYDKAEAELQRLFGDKLGE